MLNSIDGFYEVQLPEVFFQSFIGMCVGNCKVGNKVETSATLLSRLKIIWTIRLCLDIHHIYVFM